jgi:uncharacterized protein YifN (PemK superfamily)
LLPRNSEILHQDIEQFQQKCVAVFRPELRKNREIAHIRASEKNGNARASTLRKPATADRNWLQRG